MAPTLELPNGDVVTPDDVFLYNGYPYRFVPAEDDAVAFLLSPLYWGGGEMDIPFQSHGDLQGQWGDESRGLLSEAEWESWLADARDDDRFDEAELDALARELTPASGVIARIRAALGV